MALKTVDAPQDTELRWRKIRSTERNCKAKVAGCADVFSAHVLAELAAEVHGYGSVEFDVSELYVADATFLRFLLGLRAGGRTVRVLGARAGLKRALEATGLGHLFS